MALTPYPSLLGRCFARAASESVRLANFVANSALWAAISAALWPLIKRWLGVEVNIADPSLELLAVFVVTFALSFCVLFLGRLMIAPYTLYRELERRAKNESETAAMDIAELKSENTKLKADVPELRGEFLQTVTGSVEKLGLASVAVALRVANIGSKPSIVEFLTMTVTHNGRQYQGRLHSPDVEMVLKIENGGTSFVMRPGQMIYEKAMNPVVPGAVVSGPIWALFEADLEVIREGVPTVRYRDVLGREYEVSPSQRIPGPLKYYPDMRDSYERPHNA